MKRTVLIFLLIPAIFQLHAQNPSFSWARQFQGATSYVRGSSVATDAQGNSFTFGHFFGTMDIDPGPGVFNLTSGAVSASAYICKMDGGGNFIWAKQFGTVQDSGYVLSSDITVDASGNIVAVGSFKGTVDFDPGPGVYNLTFLFESGFVFKLDHSGNFLWAKRIPGGGMDNPGAQSVATDAGGNVYVGGAFGGTADFDPGPGVLNLNGDLNNVYVCKFDAVGNFLWAKAPQPQSLTYMIDNIFIDLDAAGNVYCTGDWAGTVDFDPGPGVKIVSGAGNWDAYIWKLTSNGDFVWAFSIGNSGIDGGFAIGVDGSGNVYTSGYFSNQVDFDPGPGIHYLNGTGSYENTSYICKFDASGAFVWAKNISAPIVLASAIDTDPANNIYVAGLFRGTADFDPGPGIFNLIAPDQANMFIYKIDSAGSLIWVKQATSGDATSFSRANDLVLDHSGNIFTVGDFKGTVDFDPDMPVYNLVVPSPSIFLHKLVQCTGSSSSALNITSCKSYSLNGQTYDSSGTYLQTVSNNIGCDSVITLHLTINRITADQFVSACDLYTWHGKIYSNSGIYSDTIATANACDTIVNLHLTINHPVNADISKTICFGQSYEGHSAAGIYIDSFVAANGCDSIRRLELFVLTGPAPNLGADTVLCAGDSLKLYPGPFNTYLWQNGSSQNSFIVHQPGIYSVQVTDNCGSNTDEIVIRESLCDLYFPSAFTPNGDGKNDQFKILGTPHLNDYDLKVYNRFGQLVFATKNAAEGWNGLLHGKLQPSGVFVWQCSFQRAGSQTKSLMRGTVVLIR